MPKRVILRLIRGGKVVEGPAQPDLPPTRASSEKQSPKDYRACLAYLNDPVLDSLLDDYDMAVDSLRQWQRSRHSHAAERVLEYQILVAEIEAEILATLDKRAT